MGIDFDFKDNSEKVLEDLKKGVEMALIAIGATAESHAKTYIRDAPAVVTGRLMNSISHEVDMDEEAVYIGTNVEYARGIETGTHRKKGAVHYLQRSATEHTDEYERLAKSALNSV